MLVLRGPIKNLYQYKPSKSIKNEILYNTYGDLSVQYTYFTLPYTSKPENLNDEVVRFI